MDIREFLEARLAEEQRDADLVSSGGYQGQRWRLGDPDDAIATFELTLEDDPSPERYVPVRAVDGVIGGEYDEDSGVVAWVRTGRNEHLHVQRYDPARALRDVEAKRRILAIHGERGHDEYCSDAADPCIELRALASVWSERPDYDPTWSLENVVPHV